MIKIMIMIIIIIVIMIMIIIGLGLGLGPGSWDWGLGSRFWVWGWGLGRGRGRGAGAGGRPWPRPRLPRLIWKEILSTLCSVSIMKNYEPFLRNKTSNIVVSCQLLTRFRYITSLLFAMFLWTPICQTSAVFEKYNIKLSRVISASDQISPYHLFPLAMFLWTSDCQTIQKSYDPFFEKHNIKDSRVMSPSDQILPNHIFPSRCVSMSASLSNQRG